MRPLRLKFQGLRSWREEVEVDFEDLGLFALIGDTGAGKSSILDALYFALYGSLTWDSASAKPLISIGMKRMSVELDFTADGRTYRVSRAMSPGNYPPAKHLLECLDNPEERYDYEPDIKEQIKRLVGLDAKAFQMAVLLPQGKFSALLCANPAVRTDLLKGIFRLDVLDRVRQEAENLRARVAEPLDRARRIRAQYPVDPRAELATVEAELTAAESRAKDLTAAFQALTKAHAGVKQASEMRVRATTCCKQLSVKLSDDLKALQPIADEIAAKQRAVVERRNASKKKIEQYGGKQTQAKARGLDLDSLRRYESGLNAAAEDLHRIDEKNKKIEEGNRLTAEQKAKLQAARGQSEPAEAAYQKAVSDEEEIAAKVEALNGDVQNVNAQELQERALATLSREIAESDSDIKKAGQRLAKDQVALKEKSETLERLRSDLEKARLIDEAKSIAARVHPGEDCPVCQQVVPADFKPQVPQQLQALTNTVDTLSRQVEQLRTSVGATTQYCETEQKKQNGRIARRDELQDLLAGRMAAITKRLHLKGKYDAAAVKAHIDNLLKSDRAALAQARKATLNANTALEAAKNVVNTAEMRLRQFEDRLSELNGERSWIEEEYGRRFDRFPKDFVPKNADIASVNQAKKLMHDLLVAAKAEVEALQAEQTVLNRILEEERDLQKEKYERVDIAVQDAKIAFEGLRDDLTIAYELLNETLPDLPTWSNEDLATATKASSALEKTARAAAKLLNSRADQLEQDARKHADTIRHVEQKYGGTIDAIREMCVQAEATELNYKQQKGKLTEIIPKTDELDALITPVDELQAVAGELMGVLTPGKFLQFALSEKQTALLAIASDTFKRMTGGRFGFGEKFQIIDNDWASERSAHTLSGGETFIASLALALSLVEMASRSGGRLDGFFLDEGFGSLDQEYLDSALEELERHASKGRIVGLISHIRDIAERVPMILYVQRTATGSKLRTVSDSEREEFIEAGLERAVLG